VTPRHRPVRRLCSARPPAGAASLLPPEAYPRLLRASPTSGELYHILGLEPASGAQLAARLLLPRLGALPAAAAASLLTFVVGEWGSMKVRRMLGVGPGRLCQLGHAWG
jgi:hypothetical protein